MIRDFTDETKHMLGDALEDWYDSTNYRPILDNSTLTVDILEENYVLYGWEIDDEARELMRDEELKLTDEEAMRHLLDEIFEKARTHDVLASIGAFGIVDKVAEPYISTLRELVEKINVSGLGNDAESVDSIFGSSKQFKASLDNIGYGLLQTTYESLNPDVNGWDNFDALMSKNPDEVKPWELRALSMIVDSYLEIKAETGQIGLNTEKYEEFLEHCYQLTYCHVTDWHGNNYISWTTTTVELSPVAVLFADYRAEYTNNFLDTYGYYMYSRVPDSYEANLLVAECQANDILTAMVLYGQKFEEKERGYTEPDKHISISSFGDPPIDLTLSLFGYTDVAIYGLSGDLGGEFSNGSGDAEEEGKIDVSNAMLGVICSNAADFGVDYIDKLPIVGPIVGGGYKIYSMANDFYSAYQDAKNENELRDEYIHDIKSSHYIDALHIGGTIIQCGDNATINHIICDKNQLMVDVA
ncbi:MAG: hypothetical protein NC309_08940, partial [Ruminococcus sp.]|nr:hypothetical protein [Ruminococcus sp.]